MMTKPRAESREGLDHVREELRQGDPAQLTDDVARLRSGLGRHHELRPGQPAELSQVRSRAITNSIAGFRQAVSHALDHVEQALLPLGRHPRDHALAPRRFVYDRGVTSGAEPVQGYEDPNDGLSCCPASRTVTEIFPDVFFVTGGISLRPRPVHHAQHDRGAPGARAHGGQLRAARAAGEAELEKLGRCATWCGSGRFTAPTTPISSSATGPGSGRRRRRSTPQG